MSEKIKECKIVKLFELNLTMKLLLILSFEVGLTIVILTTMPFDGAGIQFYDLFVFGELLAVTLLDSQAMFFVAILNSLFIVVSLFYRAYTVEFSQVLQLQFWLMLLRPIVLQFLITLIGYLWVTYVNASINRVRIMETQAVEAQQQSEQQRKEIEKNMLLLQNNIERIVHKHAVLMNQRLFSKLPLAEYEPMLWPLINAFNSLQSRLQHTYQIEHELQDLQEAISTYVELIQLGKFSFNQLSHTHTALDMLLYSLSEAQRADLCQDTSPASVLARLEDARLSLENASTLKLELENFWMTHSQELYAQGKKINHGWDIDYFEYTRSIKHIAGNVQNRGM